MARTVERTGGILLPVHPLQLDVLKVIACICMLIDHINTCLLGREYLWMYLVGRLAFPLFAICFVVTLTQENALRTAKRTVLAGVLVQPIYAIAFADAGFSPWWAGNILFSFAAVAYLVGLSQAPSPSNGAKGLVVFVVASIIQTPSSFGVAGLGFLFALYHAIRTTSGAAALWATVVVIALAGLNLNSLDTAGLLTVIVFGLVGLSAFLRYLVPHRLIGGSWSIHFYAAHLGLISAAATFYV